MVLDVGEILMIFKNTLKHISGLLWGFYMILWLHVDLNFQILGSS